MLQCENRELKDQVKFIGSKMVPNYLDKSRRMHMSAFKTPKLRINSGRNVSGGVKSPSEGESTLDILKRVPYTARNADSKASQAFGSNQTPAGEPKQVMRIRPAASIKQLQTSEKEKLEAMQMLSAFETKM